MTNNPSLPHRDTLKWLITTNYRTYLSPALGPHPSSSPHRGAGMEAGHRHPPQQRPGPTGAARCSRSPAPVRGQVTTATRPHRHPQPRPVPSLRAGPSPAAAALTAPGCARRAPPRPPGPGGSARSAPGSGRAPLGRRLAAGGGSVGRLRARPGRASAPAPGQRGGCCGRGARPCSATGSRLLTASPSVCCWCLWL